LVSGTWQQVFGDVMPVPPPPPPMQVPSYLPTRIGRGVLVGVLVKD